MIFSKNAIKLVKKLIAFFLDFSRNLYTIKLLDKEFCCFCIVVREKRESSIIYASSKSDGLGGTGDRDTRIIKNIYKYRLNIDHK